MKTNKLIILLLVLIVLVEYLTSTIMGKQINETVVATVVGGLVGFLTGKTQTPQAETPKSSTITEPIPIRNLDDYYINPDDVNNPELMVDNG